MRRARGVFAIRPTIITQGQTRYGVPFRNYSAEQVEAARSGLLDLSICWADSQ